LEIFEQVWEIWSAGGTLMIPLAILSFTMYYAIFQLFVYFKEHDYSKFNPNQWNHWIERPEEATGELGQMVRYAQQDVSSVTDVRSRIAEIRAAHLIRIQSRMQFAAILVSTAPLMGLLGTVVGMLATFRGLANSAGGQAVDVVAGGISEALITTQTGLILAIPGYVLISTLKKKQRWLEDFIMQVEISTLRSLTHRNKVSDS
jgi:biopolymer transport protein ExbB